MSVSKEPAITLSSSGDEHNFLAESDPTLGDEDFLDGAETTRPLFDDEEEEEEDEEDEDDDSFTGDAPTSSDQMRINHITGLKKKKLSPQLAAMTATSSQAGDRGPQGENTGRWTAEEHSLFLQGLEQHGKGWKKIAQLIKSRTVVQIRTHAQKYFQKMTKARQNGEEGEVIMEGRGGVSSVASASPTAGAALASKRRRPTTGTKRKAIQSVVSSAIRQGKRMAAAQVAAGVKDPTPPLPSLAPILAHFILPQIKDGAAPGTIRQYEDQTTISGPVLEDSIFRFLTPAPIANDLPLNDVARQAGANPIIVPNGSSGAAAAGGEISPTGVADLSMYPSWVDGKNPPSWYAKGADVDALLDISDSLDWLADTGDLQETYQPPLDDFESGDAKERLGDLGSAMNHTSVATLPHVESVVPPLPSLFGDSSSELKKSGEATLCVNLKVSASATSMDEHLQVFESSMEEHDFVSTILENNNESTVSLPALN
ncbi:hypothetical protein MPSEU_000504800 [Mayamaea pseudoterrestris]|nr:hypothetical protein MPSEU_000504800 [Mayamaea pseudoterrestris]